MTTNAKMIEHLNSLLRGERAAVETYEIARAKVSALGPQGELDHCLHSHQERVDSLTSRVAALGGEPARSSGAWGRFAKLFEEGAAVLGEGAAIAALEEGEDHGVRDYRAALEKQTDEPTHAYVRELFERQLKTHAIMSNLKKLMGRKPRPSAPAV